MTWYFLEILCYSSGDFGYASFSSLVLFLEGQWDDWGIPSVTIALITKSPLIWYNIQKDILHELQGELIM